MRRLLTLLLLTLLAFGCTPILPPSGDLDGDICQAQHVWNNYHWHISKISPVVDAGDYDVGLQAWNDLMTPLQFRSSGPSLAPPITVTNGGDEFSDFLGLAKISVDMDGHIDAAAVIMNDILLAKYPPAMKKKVGCQELGHTGGLGHQEGEAASCMNDCQGSANWSACMQTGLTPNQHDREQLLLLYAHPDDSPPLIECAGKVLIHKFPVPNAPGHHAQVSATTLL